MDVSWSDCGLLAQSWLLFADTWVPLFSCAGWMLLAEGASEMLCVMGRKGTR